MPPYRESAALGATRSQHAWTGSGPLWVIGACFIGLPLIALLLPVGDDWTPMAYLGAILAFVVMPGLGIAMWVSAYRLRSNFVALHEDGFFHRWSGVETSTRYDEVTSITQRITQQVRNGMPGPVVHRHSITTSRGELLQITHGFDGVEALIREIERRSREARLEHARRGIARGETLQLGPFGLSRTHLLNGGNAARLTSIARIVTSEGLVHVDRSGEPTWAVVQAQNVPDLDVLIALVSELQAGKPTKR